MSTVREGDQAAKSKLKQASNSTIIPPSLAADQSGLGAILWPQLSLPRKTKGISLQPRRRASCGKNTQFKRAKEVTKN